MLLKDMYLYNERVFRDVVYEREYWRYPYTNNLPKKSDDVIVSDFFPTPCSTLHQCLTLIRRSLSFPMRTK